MSISNATRLQRSVLRIASRDGADLDLAPPAGTRTPLEDVLRETIRPGDQILFAGAGPDPSIAGTVARLAGPQGAVLVIESNPELRGREITTTPDQATCQCIETDLDDFRTSPEFLERFLAEHPATDPRGYRALQDALAEQRAARPLVPDGSLDLVVVNAANQLPAARVTSLLAEAYRTLRRGGRLLLSLLLADEPPPAALPSVSGGASTRYVPCETEILALLAGAGYHGMRYTWRAELPLKVVAGVELRPFLIEAHTGKLGPCLDRGHAVLYRGPWREVLDDDDHRYRRGERTAVCEKTYALLMQSPYRNEFFGIPPYLEVPADQAPPFDCQTPQVREPAVTKGVKTVFDVRGGGCGPASGTCC
jgi:SAM-dependent methyltransferase